MSQVEKQKDALKAQKERLDAQLHQKLTAFNDAQREQIIELFHMQLGYFGNAVNDRLKPFVDEVQNLTNAVNTLDQRTHSLAELPPDDTQYEVKLSVVPFDGADLLVVMAEDGFITLERETNRYLKLTEPVRWKIAERLKELFESEEKLADSYFAQLFVIRQKEPTADEQTGPVDDENKQEQTDEHE